MAKKAYIGVDNVARRVKKGYIGVDGIARRIKKAYIGIGGVARPCMGLGTLSRYGTIEKLSVDRTNLAGASVTNRYAMFAGGNTNRTASSYSASHYSDKVDAYDLSLTRWGTTLSKARERLSGVGFGTNANAVFAGGAYYDSSTGYYTYSNAVDAYRGLVHHGSIAYLPTPRSDIRVATVGDYAIFAGGFGDEKQVTAYHDFLGRVICDDMPDGKRDHAAASVADRAIFAGGATAASSVTDVVYAYDGSLTRSMPTALSRARYQLAGVSVADRAILAGGYASSRSDVVDVYDRFLTRSTPFTLTYSASRLIAVAVQGFALFADGSGASKIVQAVDSSLTKIWPEGLEDGKDYGGGAAASVGDYALFAGGDGIDDLVEVYVVG